MRKALEDARVETISRADAHSVHLQAENESLRVQVSFLTAQLTAAQQGASFFRSLMFSESKARLAAVKRAQIAVKRAHIAFQQVTTDGQEKTLANAKQGSVDKQAKQIGNNTAAGEGPATPGANAPTFSSGGLPSKAADATAAASKPTAGDDKPTHKANISAAAAAADMANALSTAEKLKISAERRVKEISSDFASLRGRFVQASADLEQAAVIIEKKDAAFVQADRMRKRAEEDLIGVSADRNRLQQIATSLLQYQNTSPTESLASHNGADNTLPEQDCNHPSPNGKTVPIIDQTSIDTPAKRAVHKLSRTDSRELHTLPQTDNHDIQIPAVRAGQEQLQELQTEVHSKEMVIQRQAAELTTAAVKMTAQQGILQQLQSAAKCRELATLLFHVRLVPTKVSSDCLVLRTMLSEETL